MAGRKTVTRRTSNLETVQGIPLLVDRYEVENNKTYVIFKGNGWDGSFRFMCPYGNIGSLLWVRETWIKVPVSCQEKGYAVSFPEIASEVTKRKLGLRPSIHLKKEDARIWLQITDIKVEQLSEITEQEAVAEGVELSKSSALESFKLLWTSINGEGSFEVNPWVWVIRFRIVSIDGKPKDTEPEAVKL